MTVRKGQKYRRLPGDAEYRVYDVVQSAVLAGKVGTRFSTWTPTHRFHNNPQRRTGFLLVEDV